MTSLSAPQIADATLLQSLTPREREVAHFIARGHSNPQIAAELGIARETAKCHVSRILWKLGISRRADIRLFFPSPQAERGQG